MSKVDHLQRVLDEHTGTGTHHGALSEDILLLIPFWREGEVVGHKPGVSFSPLHIDQIVFAKAARYSLVLPGV
jgi:hypothetical protein